MFTGDAGQHGGHEVRLIVGSTTARLTRTGQTTALTSMPFVVHRKLVHRSKNYLLTFSPRAVGCIHRLNSVMTFTHHFHWCVTSPLVRPSWYISQPSTDSFQVTPTSTLVALITSKVVRHTAHPMLPLHDGSRQPLPNELALAEYQGKVGHCAEVDLARLAC